MKILLTGSSSGIGQDLTRHLGAAGHELWGLARRAQEAQLQDGRARGISFRYTQCDVSAWDQVSAARSAVESAWGSLDALVCCAAIQGPIGPTMSVDPAAWARTLAINLHGTFHCLRAFHPLLLRAARRAKILCFSGGGAASPRPNFSAYAVAKTAVVRLVENLAHEWQGSPIDINAVAPGAVHTRMTEQILAQGPALAGEKEFHAASQRIQSGSPAPAEKYTGLVSFLLSPASDGISGRLLSALWDPWPTLPQHASPLAASDIYTLRRILPRDRGLEFDEPARK